MRYLPDSWSRWFSSDACTSWQEWMRKTTTPCLVVFFAVIAGAACWRRPALSRARHPHLLRPTWWQRHAHVIRWQSSRSWRSDTMHWWATWVLLFAAAAAVAAAAVDDDGGAWRGSLCCRCRSRCRRYRMEEWDIDAETGTDVGQGCRSAH